MCADLHPNQYVVLSWAGWSADKAEIGTARARVRVDDHLLDVLERVCDPLTVIKDGAYLICAVRANDAGGACAARAFDLRRP